MGLSSLFHKKVPSHPPHGLELMREAGGIVALALQECVAVAREGISTAELDRVAETVIRDHKAIPSFLGYHGFPNSICTSINSVAVHGIPSTTDVLTEGDIVSIDCGAIYQGWHGDSAITIEIGDVSPDTHLVSLITQDALYAGIEAMRVGNTVGDISHAIEQCVRNHPGAGNVPEELFLIEGYGGHGIGRQMHADPFVPNEGKPGRGAVIKEGSALAIEPMVALGHYGSTTESDGWTVRMVNNGVCAHWEHTVVATAHGPDILTKIKGT